MARYVQFGHPRAQPEISSCVFSVFVRVDIAEVFSLGRKLRPRKNHPMEAWIQTRSRPRNLAGSRSPCAHCSDTQRCSFTSFSPSSEVVASKQSSTWPCNSSLQPIPGNDSGRSKLCWTARSGSRSPDSGHAGGSTLSSFAPRPWSGGIARGSAGTGDRFRRPVLAVPLSLEKSKNSSCGWRRRTAGDRGRSRPN